MESSFARKTPKVLKDNIERRQQLIALVAKPAWDILVCTTCMNDQVKGGDPSLLVSPSEATP